MNFRNLFLIGIVYSISSMFSMHAQAQLNTEDAKQTVTISEAGEAYAHGQLLRLARESASFLAERILQLQNDIVKHMPNPALRRCIEQEVIIRFYKATYNKIWEDKQPSWILPPELLWMLPIPRDFKMYVEGRSYARREAIDNRLIEPITPWFPATAKKEIELMVNGLTEQEAVLLLYCLYVNNYFSMFHAWYGYKVTLDYGSEYETVRKRLAVVSAPEERALFRRLYTPAEYEAQLNLWLSKNNHKSYVASNLYKGLKITEIVDTCSEIDTKENT
jgi:hypothetical protein